MAPLCLERFLLSVSFPWNPCCSTPALFTGSFASFRWLCRKSSEWAFHTWVSRRLERRCKLSLQIRVHLISSLTQDATAINWPQDFKAILCLFCCSHPYPEEYLQWVTSPPALEALRYRSRKHSQNQQQKNFGGKASRCDPDVSRANALSKEVSMWLFLGNNCGLKQRKKFSWAAHTEDLIYEPGKPALLCFWQSKTNASQCFKLC